MDVMEAIYRRRSVRAFGDAPIDRETLRFIIAAAVQAPSAMNLQPWSFVVVENRAALGRWSTLAKDFLLATMAPGSPLAHYRDRLADPAFDIFYNAPAMIAVCATSAEAQAMEDCCLAAQNLLLAAHASQLGVCWIGFARPWLNTPAGKDALGIPTHHRPVAPIVIGHPRDEPPPTARRHPDIHWLE